MKADGVDGAKRSFAIAALSLVIVAVGRGPACCDVQVEVRQGSSGHRDYYYSMNVTPAAEPSPVLKYRLLVPESDRKPGNSVPAFYRAQLLLQSNMRDVYREHPGSERHYSLLYEDVSTKDEQVGTMREIVELAQLEEQVIPELREAARRTDCVWDRQFHRLRGAEFFDYLLPDLQDSRECGWMLTLFTRLQIAERRMDDALKTMQLHYELAIDIGQTDQVIANLIAVSWINRLPEQLIHFAGSPGSPNLYWALAELPKPLIPVRGSLRYEATFYRRAIPLLDDPMSTDRTADGWERALVDVRAAIMQYSESMVSDETAEVLATLKALDECDPERYVYPRARDRLLAFGVSGEELESMPFGQAIILDLELELQRILHEYEKWAYMPFANTRMSIANAKAKLADPSDYGDSYGALIGRLHFPAFQAVCLSAMRTARDLAGLQVIEALRMHAAEAGRFPDQLRDVECVTVPNDPITGEPFEYRLVKGAAQLDLPFADGLVGRHFELTLRLKP